MKPKKSLLKIILLLSTLFPYPLLHADPPAKFTYQGNLRQQGFLVTGQRQMVFRLYTSSDAASDIWTSPAYNVNISTGVFRVLLEPAGIDWENSLWLELEVEGTKLLPREEIASVPYSINTLLHSGKKFTTSATDPGASGVGDLWMDTTLNTLKFWNGSAWVDTAGTGFPSPHAATHAGGGGDAITSLGAHNLTGDITMESGTSIKAGLGSPGVSVSTHLIVNGNVGIGTTNPQANLDVNGLFRISKTGAGNVLGFSGSVGWYASVGSEGVPNLYIGGSSYSSEYFWRANWATAGVAVNTFKTANVSQTGLTTLNVQGISGQTGDLFTVTTDGGNLGDLFKVQSNGNVGIGTTQPTYRLEVSSGAGESGTILAVSTGTSTMIELQGDGDVIAKRFIGDGSQLSGIGGTLSGGQTPKLSYWISANTLGNSTLSQDSAASLTALNSTFTVQGNAFSVGGSTFVVKEGKVGIGTTVPKSILHLHVSDDAGTGGGTPLVFSRRVTGADFRGAAITHHYIVGPEDILGFAARSSGNTAPTDEADLQMVLTSAGKVGIGTTNPGSGLHVGDGSASANLSTGAEDAFIEGNLEVDGSARFDGTLDGYGNVIFLGSGLSHRTDTGYFAMGYHYDIKLQYETIDADAFAMVGFLDKTANANNVPVFIWGDETINNKDLGFFNGIAEPRIAVIDDDADSHIDIGFNVDDKGMIQVVGAGTDLLLNPSSGNVGIGTTGPTHKLRVEGGILATSSITANAGFYGDGSGLSNVPVPENISVSTINATATTPYGGINITSNVFVSAGNVGIGTTDPYGILHVQQTAAGEGDTGLIVESVNAAERTRIQIRHPNNSFQIGNPGNLLTFGTNASNNQMVLTTDGNVGIGTTNPLAKFSIVDGAILNSGTTGGTPTSGAGTRLMWIPAKAAIRAGRVFSAEWDDANIGADSIAFGYANRASGTGSSVIGGSSNIASEWYATVAGGDVNTASGNRSFVGSGYNNTASGYVSFVGGGQQNVASNSYAFVGSGYRNTASGLYSSVPGGRGNMALGDYSFAGGFASSSTVAGAFTWADSQGVGIQNNVVDQVRFKARGGFHISTSAVYSAPGFFVDSLNRVGIGTESPVYKLDVTGNVRFTDTLFIDTPNEARLVLDAFSSSYDSYLDFTRGGTMKGRILYDHDGGVDSLAFYTDGAEKVRINYIGRVGIGTTNPYTRIHIRDDANDRAISFSTDGDTPNYVLGVDESDNKFKIHSGASLADTSDLVIDSGGNIGISTGAPEGRLDVLSAGSSPTDMAQIWRDGSGVIKGSMSATGYMQAVKFIGDGSGLSNIGVSPSINVSTINAIAATPYGGINITSNVFVSAGNLGIGTTNPTEKLMTAGNIAPASDSAYDLGNTGNYWRNAYVDKIYFGNTSTWIEMETGRMRLVAGSNYILSGDGSSTWLDQPLRTYALYPRANSTYSLGTASAYWLDAYAGKLYLNPTAILDGATPGAIGITGNMGVGTTQPGAKLHAVETSGSNSYIFVASTATDSGSYKMIVSTTGSVGIGTTAPTSKLHILSGGPQLILDAPASSYGYGVIARSGSIKSYFGAAGAMFSGGFTDGFGLRSGAGLQFGVGLAVSMTMAPTTGNIGIGTTDPKQKLEVTGDIGLSRGADRTVKVLQLFEFGQKADGDDLTVSAGDAVNLVDLAAMQGGALRLTGGLGMGEYSEGGQVHVSGGSGNGMFSTGGKVYIYGGSGDTTYANVILAHDGSTSRGNVGIGTTQPGAKLDVTGDGSTVLLPRKSATGDPTGSNGMIYYNTADAKFRCYQNGAWTDCIGAADNLGNHIATQVLQMGNYGINTSSNITAARYQINGSTVLAILPGTDSMGVGVNAGRLSTGINNLFVGSGAGYSNTTGMQNNFIGVWAGYSNTLGNNNSFLGLNAGNKNTTGSNNNFVGYSAGYENTTGGWNNFFGNLAGYNNKTGTRNVFVGDNAGMANETGSANVGLGSEAGYGLEGNSYSSSTLVGYRAGYGLTTGSDNLLLGFQSGKSLTTGSRNIIIGYDEDAPAADTNDYINIGGLLVGDMAQSTMTVYGDFYADKFYGDGSGLSNVGVSPSINVSTINATATTPYGGVNITTNTFVQGRLGIGTAGPGSPLEVRGGDITLESGQSIRPTSDIAGALGIAQADGTMFVGFDTQNMRVGIGLDSPLEQFQITGNFRMPNTTATSGIIYSGNDLLLHTYGASDNIFVGRGAGNLTMTGALNAGAGAGALAALTSGTENAAMGNYALNGLQSGSYNTAVGEEALYQLQTGKRNVAVGRGAGYSVTGSSNILIGYNAGDQSGNTGSGNIVIGHDIDAPLAAGNNQLSIGNLVFGTGINGTGTTPSTGNVGISTPTPIAKLHISSGAGESGDIVVVSTGDSNVIRLTGAGEVYANKFYGDGSGLSNVGVSPSINVSTINATATTPYGGINITSNVFVSAGNVGIGTTAPADKLDVYGSAIFRPFADSRYIAMATQSAQPVIGIYNGTEYKVYLAANYDSFFNGGNVGIGTTSPSYKLHVDGGDLAVRSQDPGFENSNIRLSDTSGNLDRVLSRTASGNHVYIGDIDANNGDIVFRANGADVVRFKSGGNVGIGTTNPQATLEVVGGSVTIKGLFSQSHVLMAGENGIIISTGGAITTTGIGHSTDAVVGDTRGLGAVDLQTSRILISQVASGKFSVIGGGRDNTAGGASWDYATVSGGYGNTAANKYSTVGGGYQNTAGNSSWTSATIGGGYQNTAYGQSATVGGGQSNKADGPYATIGGGQSNSAWDADSWYFTIAGGYSNKAEQNASVGGGYQNTASGNGSTISGGTLNTASGSSSAIAGGAQNTASGNASIIVGGSQNTASGNYSFAAGRKSSATATGTFALSDSQDAGFEVNVSSTIGMRFAGGYWLMGGNVGISTGNPQGKLDVLSAGSTPSDMAQIWRDGSGVIKSSMSATGVMMASKFIGDGSGLDNVVVSPSINVSTINATATTPYGGINITSNVFVSAGNVGIGTASPGAKLSFGNYTGGPAIHVYDFGGAGTRMGIGAPDFLNFQFFISNIGNFTFNNGGNLQPSGTNELMRIQYDGNVGIGTTQPTEKLALSGNIGFVTGGKIDSTTQIGGGQNDMTISAPEYLDLNAGYVRLYGDAITIGGTTGSIDIRGDSINFRRGSDGALQTYFDAYKQLIFDGANRGSTRAIEVIRNSGSTTASLIRISDGTDAYVDLKGNGEAYFAGNVGIGTTEPSERLHVTGNVLVSTATDSPILYVSTTTGSVGIGTTAPTHKLHVNGNAIVTSSMSVSGSALTGTTPIFQVAGATMTVLANGNVGIGTTGPSRKLHIRGLDDGADTSIFIDEPLWGVSQTAKLGFSVWDGTGYANIRNQLGIGVVDLIFSVQGVDQMVIRHTGTGSVGIGTTDPGAKLDIQETDNTKSYSLRVGTSTVGTGYHMVVSTSGSVGIGTTNPTEKLEVADTGKKSFEVRPGTDYASLLVDGIEVARMRP